MTVMCSTSSFVAVFAAPTLLELVKAADIQSEDRRSLAACIKQQQEQQYVNRDKQGASCSQVLEDPSSTILKYGPCHLCPRNY